MKKTLCICLAIVSLLQVSAQKQVTVTQPLSEFSTLRIAGNLSVEIVPQKEGQQPCMVVELNGNDEHSLTWSNRNGRLSVKMNYPNKGEMAAMTLYCDSISTIIADGADLTAKSSLQNKTLDILVKGGSKVNAEISCTDLKISVTESSVAIINGQSTYVSSQVRSKSVLDTRRLTAESMEATVKTKSEVYLYSTRRMVVDAAQDSKVFYKGEPYVLRSRTASGSAINSIGK